MTAQLETTLHQGATSRDYLTLLLRMQQARKAAFQLEEEVFNREAEMKDKSGVRFTSFFCDTASVVAILTNPHLKEAVPQIVDLTAMALYGKIDLYMVDPVKNCLVFVDNGIMPQDMFEDVLRKVLANQPKV